jgi:hypothetical protein
LSEKTASASENVDNVTATRKESNSDDQSIPTAPIETPSGADTVLVVESEDSGDTSGYDSDAERGGQKFYTDYGALAGDERRETGPSRPVPPSSQPEARSNDALAMLSGLLGAVAGSSTSASTTELKFQFMRTASRPYGKQAASEPSSPPGGPSESDSTTATSHLSSAVAAASAHDSTSNALLRWQPEVGALQVTSVLQVTSTQVKNARSGVWTFFKLMPTNSSGKVTVKCTLCKAHGSGLTDKSSTSSVVRHLLNKHQIHALRDDSDEAKPAVKKQNVMNDYLHTHSANNLKMNSLHQ